MPNLDDMDPCRHPAPDTPCLLCDQPLEADGPWVDWRWGTHDGCGECGPIGHDTVQPFHVECAHALMAAGGLSYLMPDESWLLMDTWLKPILWRAVWQPGRVRVNEAMLAHTVYARIMGDMYPLEDPAAMNPFDAAGNLWESRKDFQDTDMDAYAHCLGLTWDEAPFLTGLLEPDMDCCHAPSEILDMTRGELAAHVRAVADGGKPDEGENHDR